MAPAGQGIGRKIGLAAQLDDARGNLIGMSLLLVRVHEKLLGDAFRLNAFGHKIVAPVAQHADQFRRQRVIEQFDDCLRVGRIPGRYRAAGQMPARCVRKV